MAYMERPIDREKGVLMKKFTLDFIPYNCPRIFLPIWWIIYLIAAIGYGIYFVFYWLIYGIKWLFSPSARAKSKTKKVNKKQIRR